MFVSKYFLRGCALCAIAIVSGCADQADLSLKKDPAEMSLGELGDASAAALCGQKNLNAEKVPNFETVAEKNAYISERNERESSYLTALGRYRSYIADLVVDRSADSSGYAWCVENGFYGSADDRFLPAPRSECYLSIFWNEKNSVGKWRKNRADLPWFFEARENAEYATSVSSGLRKYCNTSVELLLKEMADDPKEVERAARQAEKIAAENDLSEEKKTAEENPEVFLEN